MPKKHTLEFTKQFFANNGCKLLAEVYVDSKTRMPYICKCGNESKISYQELQDKLRYSKTNDIQCKHCCKSKKHTLEYAKQYFTERNCVLLAQEYINNNTKMPYICDCGNHSAITFGNFTQGYRCDECGGSKKLTLEYAKQYFTERNCVLLAKEYINSKTKMPYICECNNQSTINLDNFKQGYRCNKCGIEKSSRNRSGKNHHNWNPNRDIVKTRHSISARCSQLVKRCLNLTGKKKTTKTEILLGYSRDDLYKHITSHKNWQLVKDIEWHVDHIFPVKAFIEHRIIDLKIINALENLQPLSKAENLSKKDKYDENEFIQYIKNKYPSQEIKFMNE